MSSWLSKLTNCISKIKKYSRPICMGLIKSRLKTVAIRVVTGAGIAALGLSAAAAATAVIGVAATVGAVVGVGLQYIKAWQEGRTADWKELVVAGVISAGSVLVAEFIVPEIFSSVPEEVTNLLTPGDLSTMRDIFSLAA